MALHYDFGNMCEMLCTLLTSVRNSLRKGETSEASRICKDGIKMLNKLRPFVKIFRLEQTDDGALGAVVLNGKLFCSSLEPDDNDPIRNQIPEGTYLCKKFSGIRFRNTFEIVVEGHKNVLFHPGNIEKDTVMCVLLGQYPGKLRKNRAVLNSGVTFLKFIGEMERNNLDRFYVSFVNMF